MADATSGADAVGPQRYGTIVVIGGGCYGGYYVRQLARAARAGALVWQRLVVVDRDAACAVFGDQALTVAPSADAPAPERAVDEWANFLAENLSPEGAPGVLGGERDAIVPSPLMPHLLYDWVVTRARRRWPARAIETRPLERAPEVPWQRAAPDGTHYVSFAEWMCPINCIEPRRCPETRGPRSWSLPPAIRAYVDDERARGRSLHGPIIFHCTHRAYGVGMIDLADVVAADALVGELGASGPVDILIGTASHCHGALNCLRLGE